MARAPKVFSTSNGLTESLIAVSSRARALEAWGVSQDLFKEGLARETDDPAAVALAMARPGEVVRRSALEAGAVEAALAALPKAKKGKAKSDRGAPSTPASPRSPSPDGGGKDESRGPSKAALERVRKLEGKLTDREKRHTAVLGDIALRRADLDAEETALRGAYAAKRRETEQRLADARAAVDAGR